MDQAIRISDFETVYRVDYGNDVVALVTGYDGKDPITMRAIVKDLGCVFSGQNIGAGSGLFIGKAVDDDNDSYLQIKSIKAYHPMAIESHDEYLALYLKGGHMTGLSSGNGANFFSHSDDDTLYFNTIQATGGLTATSSSNYIVIDTTPEEFGVINTSSYALSFEAQKTYVVDSAVTTLSLSLEGGLKSSIEHKNGRSTFIAIPDTCTEVTMPTADSINISEKMTPTRLRKGVWNYLHLYYTSGVNSRGRTSNYSLSTSPYQQFHAIKDLPAKSVFKDGSTAVDKDIYYKLLSTPFTADESFLSYSQQVEPLIFYSISQ